jgi:poly(3-hydroxybutyrate) depolymerase
MDYKTYESIAPYMRWMPFFQSDKTKPQFRIDNFVEETVLRFPFCNLVHFRPLAESGEKARKVLIVAPLVGHHASLCRDTVRALLPDSEVWITDWIDARLVPQESGPFGLAGYVKYLQEFIKKLGEELHVVAVGQGGLPAVAAVARSATMGLPQPATLTLLGSLIDVRCGPTRITELLKNMPIEKIKQSLSDVPMNYPGRRRCVLPGYMQRAVFLSRTPIERDEFESLSEKHEFDDEYKTVLDLDAEFFIDTIQACFKEYSLPRGLLNVDGDLVRPQDIRRTAILSVEGGRDDIAGVGQTSAVHGICPDAVAHENFVVEKANHYSVFCGKTFRNHVVPRIDQFIGQHTR